jgi:Ca2+-binding RTX toxin-like protein
MHLGLGNDTAQGGSGADSFIFDGAFSDDTIVDFHASEGDNIHISAATRFAQLSFAEIVTDAGPATLVSFANSSITLLGVAVGDLHAADFGF